MTTAADVRPNVGANAAGAAWRPGRRSDDSPCLLRRPGWHAAEGRVLSDLLGRNLARREPAEEAPRLLAQTLVRTALAPLHGLPKKRVAAAVVEAPSEETRPERALDLALTTLRELPAEGRAAHGGGAARRVGEGVRSEAFEQRPLKTTDGEPAQHTRGTARPQAPREVQRRRELAA